jgi:peroxiredoxin family protein
MPPESNPPAGRRPPDKLSLVIFSGAFDRVHYALVMAAAAIATGTPATVFFTMAACRALARPGPTGTPGWHTMPAGDRPGDAAAMDRDLGERGIAQFEELLSACAELGVRIMVCEMGLRAIGMTREDLRDDITVEETGAVTFLGDASATGTVLFI